MIAGVLLAAGASRRYGASKLTATWRNEPLVRHAACALQNTPGIDEVWVVLGNDAEGVRVALRNDAVQFVDNTRHRDGIGSSIAAGINSLPPDCDAALIALGDQPSIPTWVFESLVVQWRRTNAHIVAARYRGVPANPVLFARVTFPELVVLTGDAGARSVVMRVPSRVSWVDIDAPIPADVDTPDDLARL